MTMWLYQLSEKRWAPDRFRLEIWEHEKWNWSVGDKAPPRDLQRQGIPWHSSMLQQEERNQASMVGLLCLSGFREATPLYFRPVTPSDYLKMRPWWGHARAALADEIRGTMKQGTSGRSLPRSPRTPGQGSRNGWPFQAHTQLNSTPLPEGSNRPHRMFQWSAAPNNSMEPTRPARRMAFYAILALGWPGGSPTGVLRESRGR